MKEEDEKDIDQDPQQELDNSFDDEQENKTFDHLLHLIYGSDEEKR